MHDCAGIDVSNPAAPREIGALATPRVSFDIEVVGELAYLASEFGLRIMDVSSPETPLELGDTDDSYDHRSYFNTYLNMYSVHCHRGLQGSPDI